MKRLTFPKVNIILFVLFILVGVVAIHIPIKPIDVKSVTTSSDHYVAGGEFKYEVNRCRNVSSEITGQSSRYLEDVQHPDVTPIDLGSVPPRGGERGCGIVKVTVIIPDHVPTGIYRLKIVATYDLGFLRGQSKPEILYSDRTFIVEGTK